MKVPNNISHLLRRRATLAATLMEVDYKIAEWLDKKGIEVEDYDIHGGAEIFVNPHRSAERIREAIKNT